MNNGLARELRLICGHDSRSVDGCVTCESADALEAMQAAPTIDECEACFTPDACRLRGKCDHYSAERLRVAKASAAPTLTDEQIEDVWTKHMRTRVLMNYKEFARAIERAVKGQP